MYILYTARSAIPAYQLSGFGYDIIDYIHNSLLLLSDAVSMCSDASARNLGFTFDSPLTFSD